ncbi:MULTISPECIES: IclR family transcriptional regulator [unclassified Achromobacter]|uniref:IclR family transcriptional regulator n=1 Tax=unclassified Achromobacter TaxID=2626865 RepID=UPI0013039790|nr:MULTISPECIES: IclR family transcriptional regulator [unclassified Achromobacter]
MKSAVRVLQIFQLFAELKTPASLASISQRLEMPKSSCQALLRTLEAHGYLSNRDDTKDYYPTRKLFEQMRVIVEQDPLLKDLMPLLQALSDETGETVFLARREGTLVHYMEVVQGRQTLRFAGLAGDRSPLYIGAAGQSLLGGMPKAERVALVNQLEFQRYSPNTIVSASALLKQIDEGLKKGWFLSIGGFQQEVSSIGNYVWLNDNLYAIVIAAPTQRVERNQKSISRHIVDLCARVTQRPATRHTR